VLVSWLLAGQKKNIHQNLISMQLICIVRYVLWPAAGLLLQQALQAQDLLSYVNPMIGTGKSDVYTRWGNEGGTYPGAVAPWGYVQMTPETRAGGGYDYTDSSIGWFSCVSHMSGYPGGSAGGIRIMPVGEKKGGRLFLHRDEEARPGYYRVLFTDNGTLVEATAGTRTGWLRCTFPAGVKPMLFVGGIGRMTSRSAREEEGDGKGEGEGPATVIHFDRDIGDARMVEGGQVFSFASAAGKATVVVLGISVSAVGAGSAEKNLQAEASSEGFDGVRKRTQQEWRRQLSVITVRDERVEAKTIFYTALYHSLLLPWIISDVEGNYIGRDGLIHRTTGTNEYGGFSPWDTFRSLHPLLTLLFPERQRDMVLSMLDVYRQTGYLPTDPMTGNHAIPILVDSWLKGIRGFDTALVWQALKKGVVDTPYRQPDRAMYGRLGYIPFTEPESVTRTVEYAYDDWVLSRFAGKLLHRDGDEAYLLRRSYNYRNLFDPAALLFLPREGDRFRLNPGNSGYKEGDAWVYTYFVPQHPKDLINLLGGEQAFTERLDSALSRQDILFDNETVFHIPYLFDDAGLPAKTQEWVSAFRDGRFAATPGGMPGNDDLGAFSSWYVFSAMGFYPVCPGRPEYNIGTPLFRSVVLHLAGDRSFTIRAPGADWRNRYIRSVQVNHRPYDRLALSHELIRKGGDILFDMSGVPADGWTKRDEGGGPAFSFSRITVSKNGAAPHELLQLNFVLRNAGNTGTKIVKLLVNGHEYVRKNCLVMADSTLADSIGFRLYPFGKTELTIEGTGMPLEVEVRGGEGVSASDPPTVEITGLLAKSLLRIGEKQSISFDAQNIGGSARRLILPVLVDERVVLKDTLLLQPGEKKTVVASWLPVRDGLQVIRVNDVTEKFRVYSEPAGSLLLSLSLGEIGTGGVVPDASGFGNQGMVKGRVGSARPQVDVGGAGKGLLRFGKDCYVEVSNAPSLDRMGKTITMMAWVYPMARGGDLVDLFTKGDNHVLQIKENRSLSFFAGGWGRGDCTVDLPADWLRHWHSIAGVCTGEELLLYIDGELKGRSKVDGKVNLSVSNHWVLGRNEEFPGQRIFEGYMDRVRVWAEPLSAEVIKGMAREPVPVLVQGGGGE
jgi:putative alpha-1,2-mannosidase